jgi:phosphoribosylglycinamide formyltransferase-1
MSPKGPLRLAVLISGGGRTLLNLHRRIQDGSLRAAIATVVSSRGDGAAVTRARSAGLPTVVIERRGLTPDVFQRELTQAVAGVDLVCMAGFLSLWRIPDEFYGRAINIHPALLPEFGGAGMYGRRVHEAVLAAGKTVSGCTVHFCDNQYDHGPIILQRTVPVLPDDTADTLAARVFEQECIAYPEAIRLFADGRIRLHAGSVRTVP